MSIPSLKKMAASALTILSSKKFFYGIVALLILQAVWVAITARYPMAFDENFHWGIIKIYSHQWGPFITSTPPNSGEYGELVRTPSYLYHYLMSFPYRLAVSVTSQEMLQIIFLRFINIALFAAGLFAFRRILLKLRFSAAITNLSLLMIILVPVVPFLAGQINYDNLLFLLVPITLLLTISCKESLSKRGLLPARHFVLLLALGMLGSIVKYAYLPIFFAAFAYLTVYLARHGSFKSVAARTWQSFQKLKPTLQAALITILIIAGGLFAERYAVNVVVYKSLDPDCTKVESISHCIQYGPWERNHIIDATNKATGNTGVPNLWSFLPDWIQGMMHRLYFAINYDYINYYALPVPIAAAYIIGGLGILLLCVYFRAIFKASPMLILVLLVIGLYVGALLYTNFSGYLHYKTLLAINGRYLVLILPFVFALIAAAYGRFLRQVSPRNSGVVKTGLAVAMILITLQGAGILTFAIRSDDSWYWQNSFSQGLGRGLKNTVTPLVYGADHREEAP